MTDEQKDMRAKKLLMKLVTEFTTEDGTFTSDDLQDIVDICMHAASLGCQFREQVPGQGVH